jgi:chitodextrinase
LFGEKKPKDLEGDAIACAALKSNDVLIKYNCPNHSLLNHSFMKKKNGLIIKTVIVVLLAGSWLMACRREIVRTNQAGTNPRAVLPAGQYSVIYDQIPADSTDDVPRELGMKFKVIVPGTFTKISFYKMVNDSGTHIGHLWDSAGNVLATVTFSGETARGWQFAALATPYSVTVNKTYIVSVTALHGYAYTHGGLGSSLTNGPMVSVADGNNGVYASSGIFPTSSYLNSNYYRDVVFVPTSDDPTPPTAPTSLAAASITDSTAMLSWTASTDNVGVTGYEIWRNGYLVDTISGTATTRKAIHLDRGGLYSFSVKARDAFGNRGAASNLADFSTTNSAALSHGSVLDTTMVGPQAIGISSFVTVSGGSFYGAALGDWGSAARTVAAGGETIDGFWFPAGTVVLQGANISSLITVYNGWLVIRGCKGQGLLGSNIMGDNGGVAALYCNVIVMSSGNKYWHIQPIKTIVHRCYFPHNGLENVYSDNVTVTECWITPEGGAAGEHVDGVQTWGGQHYLNFSRNHFSFVGPDPNSTFSGMLGMYGDGADDQGYIGYDHYRVENNYFILGTLGIAMHAPLGVPATFGVVTGNRWTWSSSAGDKDHSGAVYLNVSQTIPNYHAAGSNWSNNKWVDGPYAGQYLLPSDVTDSVDY